MINITLDLANARRFQGVSDSQLIEWVIENRGHYHYEQSLEVQMVEDSVVIHANIDIPHQSKLDGVGIYIHGDHILISSLSEPERLTWKAICNDGQYGWIDRRNAGADNVPNHPLLGIGELRKLLTFILRTANIGVPSQA